MLTVGRFESTAHDSPNYVAIRGEQSCAINGGSPVSWQSSSMVKKGERKQTKVCSN
jgi:hypothetical protein